MSAGNVHGNLYHTRVSEIFQSDIPGAMPLAWLKVLIWSNGGETWLNLGEKSIH